MDIVNRVLNRNFLILFFIHTAVVIVVSLNRFGDSVNILLGLFIFLIQIIISLYWGYIGAVIALLFNSIGLFFVYRGYNISGDRLGLGIGLFMISGIVATIIISYSSEKNRRLVKILKRLSIIDPVTKVYNYRHFLKIIFVEVKRALRSDEALSLIYFDIDNFENINKLFGFKFGDRLLKRVAQHIKGFLREYDYLSRHDGDLFSIILPNTEYFQAREIINRIIKGIADLNSSDFFSEKDLNITLSLGYSSFPKHAQGEDELITQAKSAHYNSKQSGRNRYSLYFDIFSHVKKNLKTENKGFMESLKMVLWTLSAKDHYTYGHSERVARYSVDLAREVGLGDDEVVDLEITSLLHDVGKIDIPLSILNKKEGLTSEELEKIREHPGESRRILMPLKHIHGLLDGVLYHHERYDGKGYPEGLKSDNIPLIARIISIADAFDAMRSDRPYRAGLDLNMARDNIIKNLGIQFDPELGALFVERCIPRYEDYKL